MIRTLASLLLATTSVFGTANAQVEWLAADLDGGQEVPPVTTSAQGWCMIRTNTTSFLTEIFVHTSGVPAVAAHMHRAPSGSNGPVIVGLTAGPNNSWSGAAALSPADHAALLSGQMYINVHSTANPGGEIRGQIGPSIIETWTTRLDGSQEVPPNGSSATGTATLRFHRPSNVMTYEVTTTGMAPVAAHIHTAPVGSNGPIAFPLNGGAGGAYCGVTGKWTPAQIAALNAGDQYINVHSAAFPGGEIRGQLRPLGRAACMNARIDGGQEVPPSGSAAIGHASVSLNPDNSINYDIVVTGVVGVAAHIHRAPFGVNGPIVVGLSGGPTIWSGTSAPLTPAQIQDAINGLWYVNVHSAAFPGGEIRGQLAVAESPGTFGKGCPGTAGRTKITSNHALLGQDLDVSLHGAPAGAAGAFLFGFSQFYPPIDLTILNFTDCFLHTNSVLPINFVADPNGCTSTSVSIANSLGLIGTELFLQGAVIDFGANPGNVTTSDLLFATIL